MTTAAEIITSARYDLRDEEVTQYTDAMLLDFLNRGLRPLCAALASFGSDWVLDNEELTLAPAANSVVLPTLFVTPLLARIGSTYLVKKSVMYVRDQLIDSTAGQPNNYAIQGLNLLVERAADQAYTITLEFNTGVATLESATDMPFNGELNDVLRSFVILLAKSRNEYIVVSDAAIQDFFYSALLSKGMSRIFVPNTSKTDF